MYLLRLTGNLSVETARLSEQIKFFFKFLKGTRQFYNQGEQLTSQNSPNY